MPPPPTKLVLTLLPRPCHLPSPLCPLPMPCPAHPCLPLQALPHTPLGGPSLQRQQWQLGEQNRREEEEGEGGSVEPR